MSKLLIVDDEFRIREIIKKYAEFEGHTCVEAKDGMDAVEKAALEDFDLIIMDVMMPELDGFSACKEIRKHSTTPIIILSARGEEYDRIHGFELGIDDYVVKPFSPKELMMRVAAVIKRSKGNMQEKDIYMYEGLSVDFSGRIVTIDGERAEMTPKEYDLFFYMVKNKGIALTREKLISYLSEEAKRHGSGSFSIPFNRQQLADFLSVDRSAMSNELCRMRDEGLLTFSKNNFTLLDRY